MAPPSPPRDETVVQILHDESWKQDLKEALEKGNWERIEGLIHDHGDEAFKAKLNENGDTLLLSAFNEGKGLIEKVVEKIKPALLTETDNFGNTALHIAASVGNVEDAKLLVKKNNELLNIGNQDGYFPIQLAARREQANARRMTSYLLKAGKEDENRYKILKEAAGASVMQSLIKAEFYDLALDLLEFNENLALDDHSPLEQLASDTVGFKSAYRFSSWQSLLYSYSYVPTKQNGKTPTTCKEFKAMIWNVLAKVLGKRISHLTEKPKRLFNLIGFVANAVPRIDIPELKSKHHHALELVKNLCKIIAQKDSSISKLGKPLLLGAQNGIEEIVQEILSYSPTLITYTNKEHHSIFHVAVMYRQENILKIAHDKNKHRKGTYHQKPDHKGNNLLHLVGYKPLEAGIDTQSGAIFQMQRELQWFKKVTKLVTPQEYNSENNHQKKPFTLFKEEHADMAANEKEWMSGMATTSSIAASLVATVAFAAAFQVPDGHNDNGKPKFSNETSFIVFAVSDALALFSSITSVLSFLSIFTSRYGVRDYLRALPHRVIIGLISLLFSFIFLNIAFGSTLYLVFTEKKSCQESHSNNHTLLHTGDLVCQTSASFPRCYDQIHILSKHSPSLVDMSLQCVLNSIAIKLRI